MRRVTAAIIEKGGKVLIARRNKISHLSGRWEFPGGKIDPPETPEQCLKRELKEEFNIESEIGNFVCSSKFIYAHISIKLLVYKVRHISGEFKLIDHDEIKWVALKELNKYDLIEADKSVVKKLISRAQNAI